MPDKSTERKLAAIMFTDMLGFSSLSQQDEALALHLLDNSQSLLRSHFKEHSGREVKTTGDGFLVEFTSALQASQCAIAIQKAVSARNATQPADQQYQVRIGVHLGDVVYRDGDIYGDGVNIAARIEPLAVGGGVCVSDAVYAQVHNKLGLQFQKLDSPVMKNIAAPMDVYRLLLPWEDRPPEKPKPTPFNARIAKISGALLLFLIVGSGTWILIDQSRKSSPVPSSPPDNVLPKSVAVLPFVNMSASQSDEYLSDGMTEEILNKLAQVPGLRVPGRSSCFSYKGKAQEDIFRKVGKQLNVTTILEGSVRKAGDKLRVTAQLINVADGYHLWSQTYDGDMKDILSVQSRVAQQVVDTLKIQLAASTTRGLEKIGTDNPEAHRLYLLGRYHFWKTTEEGLKAAVNYFEQATKLDPDFALAYCGLADCYGFLGGQTMPGREAWAKERELAEKALAIDPDLADAHLSLGMALASAFDWKAGEREMRRSLEINPNLPLAYDQIAWLYANLTRFDEALVNERKAVELEPISVYYNMGIGNILIFMRRYDDALSQLEVALKLNSNDSNVHSMIGHIYLRTDRIEEAIAEFRKSQSIESTPGTDSQLAYAMVRRGDRSLARKLLADAEKAKRDRYVSPGIFAKLYAVLGEKELALKWLERCFEEQDGICWGLKIYDEFDLLRNELRFEMLVRRVFPDS
ncbi:MAG: tetratricopeptide repeat protein [Armatimonadetes bacterium]|nr:tetratricopeptide repeat protein [Armatimonadota bacterium]